MNSVLPNLANQYGDSGVSIESVNSVVEKIGFTTAYLLHVPDRGQFKYTHPLLLLQIQLEFSAGN